MEKDLKQIWQNYFTNCSKYDIIGVYKSYKGIYNMKVISIDVNTKERVYTRKEVADIVGVSAQTIRLWEDAGAIPPSERDENGYRYWKDAGLEKIKAYADLPAKYRRKK